MHCIQIILGLGEVALLFHEGCNNHLHFQLGPKIKLSHVIMLSLFLMHQSEVIFAGFSGLCLSDKFSP